MVEAMLCSTLRAPLAAAPVGMYCVQVPFPRMHFLLSSMAPLAAPKDVAQLTAPRSIDQVNEWCDCTCHVLTRLIMLSFLLPMHPLQVQCSVHWLAGMMCATRIHPVCAAAPDVQKKQPAASHCKPCTVLFVWNDVFLGSIQP